MFFTFRIHIFLIFAYSIRLHRKTVNEETRDIYYKPNKEIVMNNIPSVFWLIPIASVVALGMAWFFFRSMMKEDEGTDRMKEIAAHVRKGAMAYLKQQYPLAELI